MAEVRNESDSGAKLRVWRRSFWLQRGAPLIWFDKLTMSGRGRWSLFCEPMG